MTTRALRAILTVALIGGAVATYGLAEGERDRRERPEWQTRERRDDEHPERREGRERRERDEAGRMGPPFGRGREHAERMERMMWMLDRLQDTCFEPSRAAMVALGALKDEVRRPSREIARDLERQLDRTRTLGLRNAIRLMLKDLYKEMGNEEAMLDHLRAMIAENDEAMFEAGQRELRWMEREAADEADEEDREGEEREEEEK